MMLKLKKYIESKLFSESQRRILKDCVTANKEEYLQWMVINVTIPFILILLPVLFYFLIKNDVQDFKSLIFNGSFSIMGITILFGMSSYLIKFNRNLKKDNDHNEDSDTEEEQLNEDMVSLRKRLDNYKNLLVILGSVFYLIQALFTSYSSIYTFYFFIFLTIVILASSVYIGRLMFVIKDEFFEKTYYSQVNKPIAENRDRWNTQFTNES